MSAALSKKRRATRATLHPPMDGCCILGDSVESGNLNLRAFGASVKGILNQPNENQLPVGLGSEKNV
ncbi:Uncharacterized protein APZ42_018691 [Daphnia magna]|uniref:Uncharacterized protein n=1 Tax=Daphnia magna TaxID=35525 RepID=A0A164YRL0_9CRUS|nr:Uncharacterized protein APZ42_018691 [Daphnia magna]